MLARAFGPVGLPLPAPGPTALDLAQRLQLAARIAARTPAAILETELGAAATQLRRERAVVAAADLGWQALARELAAAAGALGMPIVVLKAMALKLAGHTPAGSRAAADLDVLLSEGDWRRFADHLVAGGFVRSPQPEMEHQLPPLRSPQGGTVELHRMILGVRLRPGRSARLEDLAAAGRLRRVVWPEGEAPDGAWLPDRAILAAHAAVHGLVQHGWAPHSYPPLRTLADLADLGLGSAAGQELAAAFGPHVAEELAPATVTALTELVASLVSGEDRLLAAAPSESAAATLLHHGLAGALDADYGRSLRFTMLASPLSDLPPWRRRLGAVAGALFPSAAELAALYGPAPTPLERLGQRLGRPFDLLRRAVAYRRSGRRLAARRQPPGQEGR